MSRRELSPGRLAAVYTQVSARKRGYATELINDVIDLCEDSGFDGIVLYSEINPDFYADFGFEEVGGVDFQLELAEPGCFLGAEAGGQEYLVIQPDQPASIKSGAVVPPPLSGCSEEGFAIGMLTAGDIPWLSRHYSRWLRKQPFGMLRSSSYWQYKIVKEKYLSERSALSRPCLNLIKVNSSPDCHGYAITEMSKDNLRVLEIIGTDQERKALWAILLTQVLNGRVRWLSGWEAVIRDFEPTYKIRSLGLEQGFGGETGLSLFCRERNWGRGMILPLNPALKAWFNVNPCPMLELDHL